MTPSKKNYNKIVIKVGSSFFCSKKGEFDEAALKRFVSQLIELIKEGRNFVIVSSGAIALGMMKLNLQKRPTDLPLLMASASTGQNSLMASYSRAFDNYNVGQVLLTWDDFDNRDRYLNAKKTLDTLLGLKCVPIVNENDVISTEEIRFGDNDQLSARVSAMVSADLLIILSDVDGLLDKEGKLVKIVSEINHQVISLARPGVKQTSVGGMITKVDAAKIAVKSGIPCVIANGKNSGIISEIIDNPFSQGNWTVFTPKEALDEKKRWIAFNTKPKGKVVVDDGAKRALCDNKSLLSVGVSGVVGNFEAGSVVSVADGCGCEFARGKINFSSKHLNEEKGARSSKEVIHKDDIVILE